MHLRTWILPSLLALGFTHLACDRKPAPALDGATPDVKRAAAHEAPPWLYEELGDLPTLRQRGKLRVLMTRHHATDRLPRGDFPLDHEQNLVTEFARAQGLKPVFVYVDAHADLLPWLQAGKGDLVAASLTVTPERRTQVGFSVPLTLVREQVVTRASDDKLRAVGDLAGRKVAVRPSSSYFATLQGLKQKVPTLEIVAVDERLDTERILQQVADGLLDVTLADSSLVEAASRYLPGIRAAFDVTDEQPVAWAVRPDATRLREALNAFLANSKLVGKREPVYRVDLPGIQERRVLRVLTRNSASSYFLYRGELVGFEYDLVREFAKQHGLKLEIIVPPAHEDLLPWLLAGRGDVVAASLTANEQRRGSGAALSHFYNKVIEQVVGDAKDAPLTEPAQLAGRTLVVRRDSSYHQTLKALKEQGIDFSIAEAPAEMETEQIIDKVARGEFDLTVADSHIVAIEQTYRRDIKPLLDLGGEVEHVWAVHPENKALLAAIDAFFAKEYRGLFYNMTRNKYFENKRRMGKRARLRSEKTGQLSPYDALVRKHAAATGLDWRLVVSQMFAESRFDPKAKSWVGAKGLLQVMPRTARELGLTRLEDPETGIRAGIKYLAWTRARFEESLNPNTRIWFALAAYNAGLGHVQDARSLARQQGLDPDRWFGHVERAMLMLADPHHAQKARYGYCRGSEPVAYVADIRERFRAYRRLEGRAGP